MLRAWERPVIFVCTRQGLPPRQPMDFDLASRSVPLVDTWRDAAMQLTPYNFSHIARA